MNIAARERVRTMGILKSLGFPNRIPARLFLIESTAILVAGGALGVGLALLTQPAMRKLFGTQIPMYFVADETVVLAIVLSIAIGLACGSVPAVRASRLKAAEALRSGL